MRRSAILLVFLGSLAAAAHGQTEDPEWFLDKPIRDFQFAGLVSVNAAELRPIVRAYVGRPLTIELFGEIRDRLLGLDYFDVVDGRAIPGDDTRTTVIVELTVQERPTVSAVRIQGNVSVGNPAILDAILVKRGDMVSETTVSVDVESIRRLYLEKGYTRVQVNGSQVANPERNTVEVVFQIAEGPQTKIREVLFTGNSFASESTLRRLMKTRRQSLLSSGDFQESVFEADKQVIVDYYGQNGFIDASILRADQTFVDDPAGARTSLDITIHIEEGQQFTFGGITFDGNELHSTEELEEQVRMRTGRPVNTEQLKAAIARVQELYTREGYLETRFQTDVIKDTAAGAVSYHIQIAESDRVHIESIILSGNEKTMDYVILRELPLEEGDIYSIEKVRQGILNLNNLQYFDSVLPEFAPGSARGLADLVITMEERSTASFNFGVQFSGGDSPINGTFGWSEANFLGRGLKIGVDTELSTARQSLSLSFQEPYLFGLRWSAGTSLSVDHRRVSGVLQDVLGPVFTDTDYGNDLAVPDPYDGHYVDASGVPFDFTTLPADQWDTLAEIQQIVDDNDLQTDYEYAGSEVPSDYTMSYDKYAISASLRTGVRLPTPVGTFRVDPYVATSLDYKTYDATIYRPYRVEDREGRNTWLVVNTLGVGLAWDKRDYFVNPQSGFYLGESIASVGGVLFGWKHYIRTATTAEAYVTALSAPVTDSYTFKIVLGLHSSLSFLLPQWHYDQDSSSWLWSTVNETSDELYVDGMSAARGWRGLLTGKALWESQFEIRIPLSEQVLWWTFFFDAAGIWRTPADMAAMKIEDYYFSFGAGLRFTHPQFPIRLYLSKGFRIDEGLQWKKGDLDLGAFSLDFVFSLGGLTF
jgi:outer membrane protein insertion porin family